MKKNAVLAAGVGSSPLARGPLGHALLGVGNRGLIPARAGTTYPRGVYAVPCWAHPRSRGDHVSFLIIYGSFRGSSPLARGPRVFVDVFICLDGLIPARAGTTMRDSGKRVTLSAHPRSRGDHKAIRKKDFAPTGSSPLARGPRQRRQDRESPAGLIPARAGTTLADMGFYPLHQQNRITLKPEPKSRIHDKQQLLTTTSTAIPARLTPP